MSNAPHFPALLGVLNASPSALRKRVATVVRNNRESGGSGSGAPKAPSWGYSEADVWERVDLLRTIARRVADNGLPVILSPEEREALYALASHPRGWLDWIADGDGFRAWRSPAEPYGWLLDAAHDLWCILAGEARLLRCPAPRPYKASWRVCGKWFVTGVTRGYPSRYCSATCRKRAERWRRAGRVAEGEGLA
jgi:hypothetical protein